MSGQFGFMSKLGATDEAVAVLNDQPYIFTILMVVIRKAKADAKKAKQDKKNKAKGGKPAAQR
ncbi:uncharacterized protein B0I36DRAFT_357467 [Microdochium trichocladiopsis]|uniref:Uncharacterized protein n=1 Tax=Microdochium trichocladiopsis TaxID=1682393 RepID=A0A9P9BZH8_9PEZI|nr:uncharacterized protein B0I36DRAFT_357467 [Microdochium trichocladiopsis]KAH7040124.1 hypothetical protein B0I36DRAFT_357467 [Microdochium trichocladiopsis]